MMFEPDSMIGKYRIIRNLGAGGMADVYLVEDTTNRRQVALKVLPPEFARDPERAARFQKEVEHLSVIKHPHIITVHDVGSDGGCHYYAMPYMTGGNLKQRIQQGMSADQSVSVLLQIADALHFAHAKGLIHRDIKPENILFDAKGQAVLTDLGIARAVGSRTRMTKTGMSIGTPHYMSPEQARGKGVDARSDIYSLGVVFFEMLTGNLPYDSEDTFAVALKHVSDPLPELPPNLTSYQSLIDRMMAKEKKGRFADASSLLKAVSHLQAGRTIKRPAAATRVMERSSKTQIRSTKTEVRERIVVDGKIEDLYTNKLGMEFVYIKPGTFMMGCPDHQVILTQGYYMQTTPVTQGQWETVMGGNPSRFSGCGDNCPVESVSWHDAQDFIAALNDLEDTDRYALPTEAQWEYAARAGTTTPFYFGFCLSKDQANYNGNYPLPGCPKGKYRAKTTTVKKFPANAWGLYDMHGNVWEWVADWYGDYSCLAVTDPAGPPFGTSRVMRGGSWIDIARLCRSAYRAYFSPGIRSNTGGFRIVLLPNH